MEWYSNTITYSFYFSYFFYNNLKKMILITRAPSILPGKHSHMSHYLGIGAGLHDQYVPFPARPAHTYVNCIYTLIYVYSYNKIESEVDRLPGNHRFRSRSSAYSNECDRLGYIGDIKQPPVLMAAVTMTINNSE